MGVRVPRGVRESTREFEINIHSKILLDFRGYEKRGQQEIFFTKKSLRTTLEQ